MGISVSNQASYYYKVYEYQNTKGDPGTEKSAVSAIKDSYNISSLASAFDAVDKTVSTEFYAIGNVAAYAKSNLKLSQSDYYKRLIDSSEKPISSLVTGTTGLSGIFSRLIALSTVSNDYFEYYSQDEDNQGKDRNSGKKRYGKFLSGEKQEGILDIQA